MSKATKWIVGTLVLAGLMALTIPFWKTASSWLATKVPAWSGVDSWVQRS